MIETTAANQNASSKRVKNLSSQFALFSYAKFLYWVNFYMQDVNNYDIEN